MNTTEWTSLVQEVSNKDSKLKPKKLLADSQYKGLPTYNSLHKGVRQKQEAKLVELIQKDQKEKVNLLTDLIMGDPSLKEEEKLKHLSSIKNADVDYEIGRWLGKKLSKHERRILRVLRYIIYGMIKEERVTGVGKSLYEAEIVLSDIYEEYGLVKRKCGSYDHNQTKVIQDILFGLSTKGLHEEILFKHKRIFKTSFILQAEEITQKVTIKKNRIEIEQKQHIGIRIAVPHFLFVSDTEASDYHYLDRTGFKNFIKIKGMSQSEAAFEIAEYLEWYLSSKLKERILDLSTLVDEAGPKLKALYNSKRKKAAIKIIISILNNMVKAEYLIKEWRLGEGADDQEQLTFINLRHELFTKNGKKAQVLPLTKGRKSNASNQLLLP